MGEVWIGSLGMGGFMDRESRYGRMYGYRV